MQVPRYLNLFTWFSIVPVSIAEPFGITALFDTAMVSVFFTFRSSLVFSLSAFIIIRWILKINLYLSLKSELCHLHI